MASVQVCHSAKAVGKNTSSCVFFLSLLVSLVAVAIVNGRLKKGKNMRENIVPLDTLEILVQRVIAKFESGEINLEEAASRLVGTGKFEENEASLDYLRAEVCPKMEDKISQIEEEIMKLQAEADHLRLILGIPAVGQPVGKGRKEKTDKKRRGAAMNSSQWDDSVVDEAKASAGVAELEEPQESEANA